LAYQKKLYEDRLKPAFAVLRAETLAAYGGKCKCCGETEIAFLAIDHVENDGAAHRKEVGKGYAIYRWLKERGFPQQGFQILCANCNYAKWSQKVCPHEKQLRVVK